VGFEVGAEAYERFMGRYSVPLAEQMADLAGIAGGQRVLDVGCGPGALTRELVARLGPESVAAVDPSASFVAAAQVGNPGVDVRRATAEELPFGDDEFDAAVAQLVVHFMADPVAGLREMARVTQSGGAVAACVWDHFGGRGPLGVFWDAVRSLDGDAHDESALAGVREGHLVELFGAAEIGDVESTVLSVGVRYESFDDWWEPYTLGVGPAGDYVGRLAGDERDRLRDACRSRLPAPPFTVTAQAWAVRGRSR
jgi:SAM-dependent methyltransferase